MMHPLFHFRALQGLEDLEAAEIFQQICNQQGFGTSVWTIDLAYLLVKYGVKHQFCTETLGVDPTYADQPYYESEFESETCRINSLFGRAEESGLDVQKWFVSVQELCDHINSNGIAIVLVDSNVLNNCHDQNQEERQLVESLARLCCHRHVVEENTLPYAGHYIVVCGYDKETDHVLYKDPAKTEDLRSVSMSRFEAARRTHGTDCDIILLKLQNNNPQQLNIQCTDSI